MRLIPLVAVLLAQSYDKLAPWSGVRWDGDTPEVRVGDAWVELLEIDGAKAPDVVAFCRKTWDRQWQKRFEEDLVEALSRMGKAPGRTVTLKVRTLDTKEEKTLEKVAMTAENRRAIWEAATRREKAGPLPSGAAAKDLDELKRLIDERYSYATLRGVDVAAAIEAAKRQLGDTPPRDAFALAVTRVLAKFGDGHSRLEGDPLPPGYLPFLVAEADGRLVAFKEDRSGFVEDAHPYLRTLDGVEIAKWLKAAEPVVAAGSPAFVRSQSIRALRNVAFLRGELGLPAGALRIELESPEGKTVTREMAVAPRKPVYGDWPRAETRVLDGAIGYLRIASMDESPAFLKGLDDAMARFRETKGLIIDVRGNGGGSRAALRSLFPHFMKEGDAPRIANVAAQRLAKGEAADLSDRGLHPAGWAGWSAEERKAIGALDFKPEWAPPDGRFSEWHYFALSRDPAKPHYGKPVVVLMNEECFSATDIFLGAFKGWRNVTLLGAPSGGGSGRVRAYTLPNSGLRLRLSTMASFRSDGALYDGRGVAPDVEARPRAADLIGPTDTVLAEALRRLK